MKHVFGLMGLASLGLFACSSASSSELATNQFSAYYNAEVHDDTGSTHFAAIFDKNVGTNVVLENGDAVTVSTDKDTNLPFALGSLDVYSVDVAATDRTTATFRLARTSGVSTTSTIAIPPVIALTAPTANQEVPFAGGNGKLTLTWSNPIPGAKVSLSINPCNGVATTTGADTPDTGVYDIATQALTVGTPTSPQCISITMIRKVEGVVDPAFKQQGSSLSSTRYAKAFDINLTP